MPRVASEGVMTLEEAKAFEASVRFEAERHDCDHGSCPLLGEDEFCQDFDGGFSQEGC